MSRERLSSTTTGSTSGQTRSRTRRTAVLTRRRKIQKRKKAGKKKRGKKIKILSLTRSHYCLTWLLFCTYLYCVHLRFISNAFVRKKREKDFSLIHWHITIEFYLANLENSQMPCEKNPGKHWLMFSESKWRRFHSRA